MPDKSENRYHEDEVFEEDEITFLKIDKKPVNGIVYREWEYGPLKWEGNYKDGKLDGLVRWLHKDGHVWLETNYKDGEKDGLERVWWSNGQLVDEGNFKDGKLISDKSWDEEGNLTLDETY